ncbi:hypothetical protein C4577_05500 [Candidatus Parcubacteria bacterium]|nr:MAG: hypothetical protein C4577_05500 [Candidatus Parcubacteria bacterium]
MEKKRIKTFIIESIIIVVLGLFIGTTTGGSPLFGDLNFIDEGQFASWTNQMLLGKQMYKDIYITYGPLFIQPLYILFKIVGPSAFLVRLYLTLGSIIGIIIGLYIVYILNISKIFRWYIIVLALLLPIVQIRQALGLLVLIFAAKSIKEKSLHSDFLSGLLVIVSFLVSPEIGIFSGFIVFLCYLYRFIIEINIHKIILKFSAFIVGILVPSIVFSLWSSIGGWLGDYISVTKDVLFLFSGINIPNGQNFPNILSLAPNNIDILSWVRFVFSKEILIYWAIIFYLSFFLYIVLKLILIKKKEENEPLIMLIGLFGLALLSILIGRSGIGHFYFTLLPLFIVLIYLMQKGLFLLKNIKGINPEKILLVLIMFVIVIFSLRLLLINRPNIFKIIDLPSAILSSKNNPSFTGPITISKDQKNYISSIQSFINLNSDKSDYVFFLTDEPMMYLLINRKNPTRYDLPYIANNKNKRFELLQDLIVKKPKYIIENEKDWAVDGIDNRTRLPEISKYINETYHFCNKINSAIIYCLKK